MRDEQSNIDVESPTTTTFPRSKKRELVSLGAGAMLLLVQVAMLGRALHRHSLFCWAPG